VLPTKFTTYSLLDPRWCQHPTSWRLALKIFIIFSLILPLPHQATADLQTREWIDKYGADAVTQALKSASEQWLKNFTKEALNGKREVPGLGVPSIAYEGRGDLFVKILTYLGYAQTLYDLGHTNGNARLRGIVGFAASSNPYTAPLWLVANLASSFSMATIMKDLEKIYNEYTQHSQKINAIFEEGHAAHNQLHQQMQGRYKIALEELRSIENKTLSECSLEKEAQIQDIPGLFKCWHLRSRFLRTVQGLKPLIAELERVESMLRSRYGYNLETLKNAIEELRPQEEPYIKAVNRYHILLAHILRDNTVVPLTQPKEKESFCQHFLHETIGSSLFRLLRIVNSSEVNETQIQDLQDLAKLFELLRIGMWRCNPNETETTMVNLIVKEYEALQATITQLKAQTSGRTDTIEEKSYAIPITYEHLTLTE
jgi:hypothetical protein